MTAGTCTHPIDLAKVRLQVHTLVHFKEAAEKRTLGATAPRPPSLFSVLRTTVEEKGVLALYDGLSACLMRQMIYGTARLGLNMDFSNRLATHYDCHATFLPFHVKVLSGMASGSIAVCLGTPFDVANVRMQSDGMKPLADRRNYSSVFDGESGGTKVGHDVLFRTSTSYARPGLDG